jgi:hypothetical protein
MAHIESDLWQEEPNAVHYTHFLPTCDECGQTARWVIQLTDFDIIDIDYCNTCYYPKMQELYDTFPALDELSMRSIAYKRTSPTDKINAKRLRILSTRSKFQRDR